MVEGQTRFMIDISSAPPLKAADFTRTEDIAGITLPPAVQAFWLKNNGGKPQNHRFSTKDGKVEGYLTEFFPLFGRDADTILEELENMTLAGWIPEHMACIGKTSTENRIVVSCAGGDEGCIYYWAWDEQDEADPPSYDYMRIIADDFEQFLSMLR